jgi:DNA-binding response OmpR family regulator
LRPRRILVVDDDDSIRDFISLAFTDHGYEVATAADGGAALAIMDGFRPDLVVLDMRMPAMDGWAFSSVYRQTRSPRAPVLVLTAARDAGASAAEIQADAFLAKPFELPDLLALVERLLSDPLPP